LKIFLKNTIQTTDNEEANNNLLKRLIEDSYSHKTHVTETVEKTLLLTIYVTKVSDPRD